MLRKTIISLILTITILSNTLMMSACSNEKPFASANLPQEIQGHLSEDELSVSESGVSVTVEEGSLGKDAQVTITKNTDLPPISVEDEDVNMIAYDFKITGDNPVGVIQLEIPCSASPEEVFAAYFNKETEEWEPVEFTYDTTKKCAVISTTHLSSYAVFTIKNPNKRTAMLAFSNNLDVGGLDLDRAITMLENAAYSRDQFYEDSFDLVSECVTLTEDLAANFLEVANGLTESYVPKLSERFTTSMGYLGYALSGIEIIGALIEDETQTAVWKTVETMSDYVLGEISALAGSTAMAAGLFTSGVIKYALDRFITTALEGRADIYEKAYNLYYKENGRSTADWVNLIRSTVEKGKDPETTSQTIADEIEGYVNEFWQDDTTIGVYGKDANPGAWSTGSLGGLNDKIKKEISDYNQMTIQKIVSNILRRIQTEQKLELQTGMRKALADFQKQMNSVVNISVKDTKAGDEPSYFAGTTLRFVELPDSIEDRKDWETTIASDGTAKLRFRVLAHLLAGSPRKMELVKKKDNKQTTLVRFWAKFNVPNSTLDLAELYPEQFPENIGGTYDITMHNTIKDEIVEDLTLTVKITKEEVDGCYADFYLAHEDSVYVNGNYFYRYSTGKVNYAMGDMGFHFVGTSGVEFRLDAQDHQQKVWASFTGQK